MIKKELLQLAPLHATQKMMKMAAEDQLKRIPYGWNSSYYHEAYQYGLFMRCRIENGILRTAFYLPDSMRVGGRRPAYEVFIDRTARRFITYDRIQKKWLTAKLDRIDWPRYTWSATERWMSPADRETVKEYLGTAEGGYSGILAYQRDIRDEELERRHKKETDPWDADMAMTPDVPKDWLHWVDKVGVQENYIFYHYKKQGAKKGFCSYCGKEVPISGKQRHNQEGRCSCCRRKITFKAIGRMGSFHTEEHSVYLLQARPDGFMLRQFSASRKYSKEAYKTPTISCTEEMRIIYDRELNDRTYFWDCYKNKTLRWVSSESISYYGYYYYKFHFGGAGRIYGKTLSHLARTELKKTGLVEWIRAHDMYADPRRYLMILREMPQMEQIWKAGLPALTQECLDEMGKVRSYILDRDETNLTKALGISSQELLRLRQYDGGSMRLGWLQKEHESGRPISDDVISWYCHEEIHVEDLNFIWGKMNALQVYNYLHRQMEDCQEPARQVINTWRDYLSMAYKLGIDTRDEIVYRVKLLRQRHDELVMRMQQKDNEQAAADVLKRFPNVNRICRAIEEKYTYSNGQYTVIVPNGALDIIVEGRMLSHCVGGSDRYWERIERNEAYILFLRKTSAPQIPYYTLEVEPDGTVRQKRTKFDRQGEDIEDAKAFLMEWQKVVAARLTASDRKKAKKSQVLREQEFDQMRKDDVRIRVGDLAGQRMVDVLTADLMENVA